MTTKFVCSVLLVDDEEAITTPVSGYLRRIGWLTQVAAEAEEAMALVMHRAFDLAILDLRLTRWGGGEGLAVVEEIRRLSPATRILVLSACVDEDAEVEARRRGADAVLRKPQPLAAVARVGRLLMGQSHA